MSGVTIAASALVFISWRSRDLPITACVLVQANCRAQDQRIASH